MGLDLMAGLRGHWDRPDCARRILGPGRTPMASLVSATAQTQPAPVPLSAQAELERRGAVALCLARLLATAAAPGGEAAPASDSWAPALAAAIAPQAELDAWLKEAQALRCALHLGDLAACRSQHRVFAVGYAIACDPALRASEEVLAAATEGERQAFYNEIHARVQSGDFSAFAFRKEAFEDALARECERRETQLADARQGLLELEALCEPALRQRLVDCGEAVAHFPWQSIAASGIDRWSMGTDCLTLDCQDELWIVAQAKPAQVRMSARMGTAGDAMVHRDLLLLVDLSGSMCNSLQVLKECLRDVVAHARCGDRLCLVGFSSAPSLLCDWTELGGDNVIDARHMFCDRVEAMEAKGGTRLVPALDLAAHCLRARPSPTYAGPRTTAVMLLSDGDPEEPPDALSTAAARAFGEGSAGEPAPLVIGLALGDESRPDLMALLAQCGCGVSLYISGSEQLASQLGRMWGILGYASNPLDAFDSEHHCQVGPPGDVFLVLEGADEAEIVEAERSPGGTTSLYSSDARQLVVLRCGRHAPPGEVGEGYRLAVRLRLPTWASAPLGSGCLQRPLMRSTWVWRDDTGKVYAASDTLRAVQVPSLLVESFVGLPLRVVLAANSDGCEGFERSRFLEVLAESIGIDQGRLQLDRVSPGSIIVDLQLLGAEVADMERLRAACAALTDGSSEATMTNVLSAGGFDHATLKMPGNVALRRVLQWRLAVALEEAASKYPASLGSLRGLDEVQHLASSKAVRRFGAVCGGVDSGCAAAAVAADAAAAAAAVRVGGLSAPVVHALLQQAHSHTQQLCPELSPPAAAVRHYETENLRQASLAFQENADVRERGALPGAPVLFLTEGSGGLSLHLRSGDAGAAAAALVAFKVAVHYGDRSSTREIFVPAGAAALENGFAVPLGSLEFFGPPGAEHALAAWASNGRLWGEQSAAMLCRLPENGGASDIAASSSPTRSSRVALRSSFGASGRRCSAMTNVVECSATALGTISLAWNVFPKPQPGLRWSVEVEARDAVDCTDVAQRWAADELSECRASFIGLSPSAVYRFSIAVETPPAPPPLPPPPPPTVSDSLCVSGLRVGSSPTSPSWAASSLPPAAVEGVVALPPFADGALLFLAAEPSLRQLDLQGAYVRVASGRLRGSRA